MTFKPGDVVVWDYDNRRVYLVLKVNPDKEVYKIFVLNHPYKNYIGEKQNLIFQTNSYTNLKDIDLK